MMKCRPGTLRTLVALLTVSASIPSLISASHADSSTATSEVNASRYNAARTNAILDNIAYPLSMSWKTTTQPLPKTNLAPVYGGGLVYFALGNHAYGVRAADGHLVWTYTGHDNFRAAPAYYDGGVYLGCDDAHLYKLNAKDGTVLWQRGVSAQIRSTPVIYLGKVYCADEGGEIFTVDPATGNVVWTQNIGSAISTAMAINGSGQVFFAAGDGHLYCVNGDSGKVEWSELFQEDMTATPPAVSDTTVFVAAGRELYGLNPNRGAIRWHQHIDADITTSPTIGTDIIVIATDDGKVQARTGHGGLIWSKGLPAAVTSPALLAGNTVVVTTGQGLVYGLDNSNGDIQWTYACQPAGLHGKPATVNASASAIYADSTLFVLTDDGSISAFRADAPDQCGPIVSDISPKPGASVAANQLTFSATVVDEGTGVAPGTLSVKVDGKPITPVAYQPGVNGVRTTYDPNSLDNTVARIPNLSNGPHVVSLTIGDWKGNTSMRSWSFNIINSGAKTAQEIEQSQDQVTVAPDNNNPNTPSNPTVGNPGGGPGVGTAPGGGTAVGNNQSPGGPSPGGNSSVSTTAPPVAYPGGVPGGPPHRPVAPPTAPGGGNGGGATAPAAPPPPPI